MDSARLTIIARVVASRANRSVLGLSMESSLFEIAESGDCVRRMEMVPNRQSQFLCHWVKIQVALSSLSANFDLGQEFSAREFVHFIHRDQTHVQYHFESPEVR